uniref:Conorfamide-As1 n=1 Tax=Conus cancellatus TaxID=289020 RepID=CRF1_CONCF|nr:RecName: Full=Conorfamide-As1; AltName: Full=Conorfamide-As1a; Short=CNF-As1a; Short=Cono-RFamide-As1a; AltName: Full=Conorfamide-As1b; Short=CNF-As1b; Short=Cono-RFamide-As1b [Conus cancellatus]
RIKKPIFAFPRF